MPQVKMDVLRATTQTRFPMVVEQLAHFLNPLILPFPSPHPSPPFPSQGLFHLEQLEIPLSVERHPSLALSSHFRHVIWVQNDYNKHLNLSVAAK